MASPYAAVNARIKVMRTELVERGTLEEALTASSYQEYLRVLSESTLREDLGDAAAAGAGLRDLDASLSRNYLRTVQRLQNLAVGPTSREINALVMRYDLANLKTLVRGVLAGRAPTDIEAGLVPAGTIRPAVLQAAASSTDVASLAQTLAVGGGALGQVLRSAVTGGATEPLELEVALDQGYYRSVIANVRGANARRYFTREIDVRNLLTALQLRGGNVQARFFVPGGRDVTEGDFLRIAGGDNSLPSAELAPILEASDLGGAETAARHILDDASRNIAMGDALGAGVALDFLRRKEQEIAKLRLIGRAKYYDLPAEQIRREIADA